MEVRLIVIFVSWIHAYLDSTWQKYVRCYFSLDSDVTSYFILSVDRSKK